MKSIGKLKINTWICIYIMIMISVYIFNPIVAVALSVSLIIGILIMKSNKFLYTLFFISIILIPKYFSINISNSLPVITIDRLLLIMIIIKLLMNRKELVEFKSIVINCRYNKFFILFFLVNMVCVFIKFTSAGLNELLSIVTEQIMLFYIVVFICKKYGISYIFKIISVCIIILGINGIVEYITNTNIFNYLNITTRSNITMTEYYRMNRLRATGPFGHPLGYGLFLILITPLFILKDKKQTKIMIIGLSILNIILTGSRSTLLCLGIQCIIYFLAIKLNNKIKILGYISIVIAITTFFVMAFPNNFISTSIRNSAYMMSDVLLGTELSKDFGNNSSPYEYRLFLLSIFKDKDINPIYGIGVGVGKIFYVYDWSWNPYTGVTAISSIDNFYVQKYIETGYMGLISVIILFSKFLYEACKSYFLKRKKVYLAILMSITGYYINLFMVDELGTLKFLWIIFGILYFYQINESKGKSVKREVI